MKRSLWAMRSLALALLLLGAAQTVACESDSGRERCDGLSVSTTTESDHEYLFQKSKRLKEGPPSSAVAVDEGMDGLELRVSDCRLSQRLTVGESPSSQIKPSDRRLDLYDISGHRSIESDRSSPEPVGDVDFARARLAFAARGPTPLFGSPAPLDDLGHGSSLFKAILQP